MKWLKMILILSLISLPIFLSACGNSETPRDSSWTSATLLADNARFPHIKADENGNIYAVWSQSTGFYTNRYTVKSGWGTPLKIGESTTGWSDLQLAVSRNGHAIAAWRHTEPGNDYVQAVRYVAGTGWGVVENLGDIGIPRNTVINSAGKTYIVAEYSTYTSTGLTIAEHDQTTGWIFKQIAYSDTPPSYGFPKISIDSSGNGIVLWEEINSVSSKIFVSQRSQAGWGAPFQIASLAGVSGSDTNILLDNNGNAVALWSQPDTSSIYHTYACRYSVGNGWGAAERVDNSALDSYDQSLSVDQSGNFYAVWTQRTSTVLTNIFSCRYSPVNGWQTPQLVGTAGIARFPQIAADTSGNLFAVWQQYDPNDPYSADAKVYANILTAGSGWGAQRQLKSTVGNADAPDLAVGPAGRAMVSWSQSTGSVNGLVTYGIFFSRFE